MKLTQEQQDLSVLINALADSHRAMALLRSEQKRTERGFLRLYKTMIKFAKGQIHTDNSPYAADVIDFVRMEAATAADEAMTDDPVVPEQILKELCLWQRGPQTLISVVTDDGKLSVVEGLLDGAMVLPMHGIENKISFPEPDGEAGYRIRSLKALVASCADSLTFVREGDEIGYVQRDHDGTPWMHGVGELIVEYFSDVLMDYMPRGTWQLGCSPVW